MKLLGILALAITLGSQATAAEKERPSRFGRARGAATSSRSRRPRSSATSPDPTIRLPGTPTLAQIMPVVSALAEPVPHSLLGEFLGLGPDHLEPLLAEARSQRLVMERDGKLSATPEGLKMFPATPQAHGQIADSIMKKLFPGGLPPL